MLSADLARRYIRPLQPLPTGMQPGGALKAPVGCLLFDIYGTLLISGSGDIGIARSDTDTAGLLNPLLKTYGIRTPPETLMQRFFDAIQTEHERLRRKGADSPEVAIERIWQGVLQIDDQGRARRFALEFELIANPVYPMPHLANVLAAVKGAGLPMGIISNAQFYTPLLLEWFLKADLDTVGFDPDLVFFSYRTGISKPSLHMFEKALQVCAGRGMQPDRILYVGNDMRNDVMPAASCGMQTALFAGDRRSLRLRSEDPRCRGLRPDRVITDLEQLVDII
jgi:putative hydrolase of the HAD superfamily